MNLRSLTNIPQELQSIIYYNYIECLNCKNKKNKLLKELKETTIWLNLSEDIYDFNMDYNYAMRIPKLICDE